MASFLRRICWLSLSASSLCGACGCGSVASTDYLGEALLSLSGSVIVDNPDAPQDLVPVLAFERARKEGPATGYALRDVEYRGEFPARFRLGVHEPPPRVAMYDIETPNGLQLSYAWARLGAVAPQHPERLSLSQRSEVSYCLGKECYTDLSRCAPQGDCYWERRHCSLPDRFDAPAPAYHDCREVGTRGDLASIRPSPQGISQYSDTSCDGDVCRISDEWCADESGACEPRPDGSCRPPESQCYTRTVQCSFDAALIGAATPEPELDPLHWNERQDLSSCGLVHQSGDPDLAGDPNEWFAGLSDEAFVVYLPEDFDPDAFKEHLALPPPVHAGYSLLELVPWSSLIESLYQSCREGTEPALVDAYNAEHGTSYVLSDGIDAGTELGGLLLQNLFRCSLNVRGRWRDDPNAADLQLHVALPPAFG